MDKIQKNTGKGINDYKDSDIIKGLLKRTEAEALISQYVSNLQLRGGPPTREKKNHFLYCGRSYAYPLFPPTHSLCIKLVHWWERKRRSWCGIITKAFPTKQLRSSVQILSTLDWRAWEKKPGSQFLLLRTHDPSGTAIACSCMLIS